jgi:hypothetical protein
MPYYDYKASLAALIERLRTINDNTWSPTPRRNELLAFAKQLRKTADLMGLQEYGDLESAVDADPLPETGQDGYPVPVCGEESRLGLYQATKWRLHEFADIAVQQADSYPAPQFRTALRFATEAVLHIWYQCEKPRPTLYDNGEAVRELTGILGEAGIVLSPERIRTELGRALRTFDPLHDSYGAYDLLVINK